jgi:O-acetylserine/cysteine efflux transporter
VPIKDILLAVLVPCLWGFGFVIAKPVMGQFPPILLNGLRWSLTGLLMFWFFPFPKKAFKKLLIISFIGCTIQYSLTYSGLNMIDATSATLFIQAEIPFGILIAFLILGERPSIKNIVGLIIAFIGIIILTGSPNLEGKILGVTILLLGALFWSFAQVLAKPISEEIGGLTLTAWLGIFAGPQCIIASFIFEGNPIYYLSNADLKAWMVVIYLALAMNVLGYSIWYHVLSKHPVNYIMPVLLLFPVTGLLTAIFLLGESPTTFAYIGGSIIVCGVAIILFNKNKTNINEIN